LGFVDRFSGTLIITGRLSEVETAMQEIVTYLKEELEFAVCKITRR
jgi:ethanolamine utilization protein EutS